MSQCEDVYLTSELLQELNMTVLYYKDHGLSDNDIAWALEEMFNDVKGREDEQ